MMFDNEHRLTPKKEAFEAEFCWGCLLVGEDPTECQGLCYDSPWG